MAVELYRAPQVSYKPVFVNQRSVRPHLKLVSNNQSQINASKAAFNASMERTQVNQKYWDELLDKLRKSGGGGGSGSTNSFDRIAVSMMLSNFLSNKTVQAMLRNFNVELFDTNKTPAQIIGSNQIQIGNIMQAVGKFVVDVITNIIPLIVRIDTPMRHLYNQLSVLASILSFQLNKLKEILEEDLKEFVKKLDVKEKMRMIKTFVQDIFVETKEKVVNFIGSFFEMITKNSIGLNDRLFTKA